MSGIDNTLAKKKGHYSDEGEFIPDDEYIEVPGYTGKQLEKAGSEKQTLGIHTQIREISAKYGITDAVALNETDGLVWVRGKLPWKRKAAVRPWEKGDTYSLLQLAEDTLQRNRIGKDTAFEAIYLIAYKNRFNPIVEAYEALPAWDGKRRVGTMLNRYLGAEDNKYTTAVEQLLFSGCVMRTFEPGCKFDYLPVLIGRQGIGKSQFARMLAIDDALFTDNIHRVEDIEAMRTLQGNLVVELPELSALKGNQIEAIKSFVTKQSDDFRPMHDNQVVRHPRRCVLVGTTNVDTFLRDQTGNRRFLPVQCGLVEASGNLFSDEAITDFWQAQSEIYHQYQHAQSLLKIDHKGTGRLPLVLPDWAADEALQAQKDAEMDDPRIGIIEAWLEKQPHDAKVCAAQIANQALEIENPKSYDYTDIHTIMKRFDDWEKLSSKRSIPGYGYQRAWGRKKGLV